MSISRDSRTTGRFSRFGGVCGSSTDRGVGVGSGVFVAGEVVGFGVQAGAGGVGVGVGMESE